MSADTVEIYIPLLEEGTPTARPTQAIDLGNGTFKVLSTSDYDPEDEKWEFLPGSIVRCEMTPFRNGNHLLAVARAWEWCCVGILTLKVREILLKDWDPFGVGDNPNLVDEYDSFIPSIVVLIDKSSNAEELNKRLVQIEDELHAPVSSEKRAKAVKALQKIK